MLNRVAVFIDNSNIFKALQKFRKNNPNIWNVCLYNPLTLAQKLVGSRELVFVGFYCAPPPSSLSQGNNDDKYRYSTAMKYYGLVSNLNLVEIKYATVNGTQGSLKEKNLDTQLVADMTLMAALNKYDTAILVSNDGDYVSGVKPVKQLGKKVEVLYFKGECSFNLRKECDIPRVARPSFFQKIAGI